jgi:D-aspartate ligase
MFKYVKDPELAAKLHAMIKAKNYVNPLFYRADRSPIRLAQILKAHRSHYDKYKRYLRE